MPIRPTTSISIFDREQSLGGADFIAMEAPTLPEIAGAALRQEFIGGNISNLIDLAVARANSTADETAEIFSEEFIAENPIMRGNEEFFIGATSKAEARVMARMLAAELRDRDTLDRGGLTGLAMAMAAGVASPENAIPLGFALRAGRGVLGTARAAARAGAIGASLGEAGLQASQLARPGIESAVNVVASAAFGGVLGVTAGALSKASRSIVQRQLDLVLREAASDVENFTAAGKVIVEDPGAAVRVAGERIRETARSARDSTAGRTVRALVARQREAGRRLRRAARDLRDAAAEGRRAAIEAREARSQEPAVETRADAPERADPENLTRDYMRVVNNGDRDALQQQLGFSPEEADAIVIAREANGPFGAVDDVAERVEIEPERLTESEATFRARSQPEDTPEPEPEAPETPVRGSREEMPEAENRPADDPQAEPNAPEAATPEIAVREAEAAREEALATQRAVLAEQNEAVQLELEAADRRVRAQERRLARMDEQRADAIGRGEEAAEAAEARQFEVEEQLLAAQNERDRARKRQAYIRMLDRFAARQQAMAEAEAQGFTGRTSRQVQAEIEARRRGRVRLEDDTLQTPDPDLFRSRDRYSGLVVQTAQGQRGAVTGKRRSTLELMLVEPGPDGSRIVQVPQQSVRVVHRNGRPLYRETSPASPFETRERQKQFRDLPGTSIEQGEVSGAPTRVRSERFMTDLDLANEAQRRRERRQRLLEPAPGLGTGGPTQQTTLRRPADRATRPGRMAAPIPTEARVEVHRLLRRQRELMEQLTHEHSDEVRLDLENQLADVDQRLDELADPTSQVFEEEVQNTTRTIQRALDNVLADLRDLRRLQPASKQGTSGLKPGPDDVSNQTAIARLERKAAELARQLSMGQGLTVIRGAGVADSSLADVFPTRGGTPSTLGMPEIPHTRQLRPEDSAVLRAIEERAREAAAVDRIVERLTGMPSELRGAATELNIGQIERGVEAAERDLARLRASGADPETIRGAEENLVNLQRQLLDLTDPESVSVAQRAVLEDLVERTAVRLEWLEGRMSQDEIEFEALQDPTRGIDPTEASEIADDLGVDPEDIEDLFEPLDSSPPFDVPGAIRGESGADPTRIDSPNPLYDRVVQILGLPDKLVRKVMRFNPTLRMALSDVDEARLLVQMLTDTNLIWQRTTKGMPQFESAYDRIMSRWNPRQIKVLRALPELYVRDVRQIRGQDPEKGGFSAFTVRRTATREAALPTLTRDRLPVSEWYERVGRALRNGDQDVSPSKLQGVEEAARMIRKEIFTPALDDMVSLRMLPGELRDDYASSYFTRVWNVDEMRRRPQDWKTVAARHLEAEGNTPERALELAHYFYEKVLAGPDGRLDYDAFQNRRTRPAQERLIPGDDNSWDAEGFLVNDIDVVLRYWFRSVAPDIELARLDTFLTPDSIKARDDWRPDPGLTRTLHRAKRQAEQRMNALTAPDSADRLSMQSQIERAFGTKDKPGDLHAMVQLLRNTYGVPRDPNSGLYRASVAMRNFNYITDGGTFWLSSLPDLIRPIMVFGMRRVYGTGIRTMLKEWKTLKLNHDEALLAGTAGDWWTNRRVLEMFDLGQGFGRGSKPERLLKRFADEMSVINGLAQHNTQVKRWVGTMAGQRIIDFSEIVSTGRKWDSTRASADEVQEAIAELARARIDAPMAGRIWEQVRNNPSQGRLREFRTEEWTDTEARDLFRTGLVSTIDSVINTPKPGDRPLFFSREMGRFFLQYKSFVFASTMQTLVPGMQQPSFAWANGAVMATGMGMASVYLKSVAGGWPTPDLDDDGFLEWWIRNGVDAAGFTGILGDVNNTLGYITRGEMTVGRFLPSGPSRSFKYTSRNALTTLGGPSASTLQDSYRAFAEFTGALLAGEQPPTRAWNAMRRLTPTNNHFLLNRTVWQPLFRHAERKFRREFVDELSSRTGVPRQRSLREELR